MKKLWAIILVLTICFVSLTACTATVEDEDANDKSMFVRVESTIGWVVVYHRESKVMYVVSGGSYNQGTFTMLVNADGSPMLWEDRNGH